MRIAKAMARAGLCSRRDAERWIEEGRVSVNGKVLKTPALDVGPKDKIVVDGKALPSVEPVRLWRYYKPRGVVTTHRDPEGRPTVFEKMPEDMPRVISIGRLDFNTEGLLLLTTDGGLARYMELPATGWLRRYRVRAHGSVTQEQLNGLKNGIEVEGVRYGPVEASLDRVQGANVWLTIGLREGKNREVRKILSNFQLDVNRLIRMSYGPFQLLDMEPGQIEPVRRRVLVDQLGERLAREFGLTEISDDEKETRAQRKSEPGPRSTEDRPSRTLRWERRGEGEETQSPRASRLGEGRPARSPRGGSRDDDTPARRPLRWERPGEDRPTRSSRGDDKSAGAPRRERLGEDQRRRSPRGEWRGDPGSTRSPRGERPAEGRPERFSRGERRGEDGPTRAPGGERSGEGKPSRFSRGERRSEDGPARAPRGERFGEGRPSRFSRGERRSEDGPARSPRGERSGEGRPSRFSRGERRGEDGSSRAPRGERSGESRPSRFSRGERRGEDGSSRAPGGERPARPPRGERYDKGRPTRSPRSGKPPRGPRGNRRP